MQTQSSFEFLLNGYQCVTYNVMRGSDRSAMDACKAAEPEERASGVRTEHPVPYRIGDDELEKPATRRLCAPSWPFRHKAQV